MLQLHPTAKGPGNCPWPAVANSDVVIAALGNIHRGDEGAGVAVVRRLGLEPPIPDVRLISAGTCARRVLVHLPEARAMIVVAAAADAAPAGSVHYAVVDRADSLPLLGVRWGLEELWATATRRGPMPLHVYTISIRPHVVQVTRLSPAVAAGVAVATCMVHGHALRLASQAEAAYAVLG